MSPLRSRLGNIRPAHARTSTRNTPERASLPPVRPPEAHDATPKISFVVRARHLTLTLPRSPSLGLECDPTVKSVYLARPVYPRAFEHGTSQRKGWWKGPDYTRAGKHPASSWGWCVLFRRRNRRRPPLCPLSACVFLSLAARCVFVFRACAGHGSFRPCVGTDRAPKKRGRALRFLSFFSWRRLMARLCALCMGVS